MGINSKNKKHLAERYSTIEFLERQKTLGTSFTYYESIFRKSHVKKAYLSGWDACLKHLSTMTREQAINEIKNYCNGKEAKL